MNNSEVELEIKFLVPELDRIEQELHHIAARLIQPRVYEKNVRLDTQDQSLTKQHKILRLRRDTAARCTYKGARSIEKGVQRRVEIEFEVSSFEAALHLFQALGYEEVWVYEKYRTVYQLENTTITLDEMPFGNFVEIEGERAETIQHVSEVLGFAWEERILFSYLEIFEKIKRKYQLGFRDLTFENFSSLRDSISFQGVF